ncbi:hypothetical protein FBQ87_01830 [Sphingobacteriales bacterium CHB3]|nr:hypothetical protein [Sphingobacteriales bacterium CHB3]
MKVTDIRSTPAQLPVQKKNTRPAGEESFEATLKNIPAEATRAGETKQTLSPAALTQPEQAFFARLFPDAADEVRSYNPYRRDQTSLTVQLGTIVDRRG